MALYLEYTIFALYVLAGPVAWGVMIWAMFEARERLSLMEKSAPLAGAAPQVTVMIPVRNEAARIELCVNSALVQDYPNLRVVAIDDRSDDGTGHILDRLAERDPRLSVVHLTPADLQPGWMPKNSTLHRGYVKAVKDQPAREGDYLLTLDSDTRLTRPDTLGTA